MVSLSTITSAQVAWLAIASFLAASASMPTATTAPSKAGDPAQSSLKSILENIYHGPIPPAPSNPAGSIKSLVKSIRDTRAKRIDKIKPGPATLFKHILTYAQAHDIVGDIKDEIDYPALLIDNLCTQVEEFDGSTPRRIIATYCTWMRVELKNYSMGKAGESYKAVKSSSSNVKATLWRQKGTDGYVSTPFQNYRLLQSQLQVLVVRALVEEMHPKPRGADYDPHNDVLRYIVGHLPHILPDLSFSAVILHHEIEQRDQSKFLKDTTLKQVYDLRQSIRNNNWHLFGKKREITAGDDSPYALMALYSYFSTVDHFSEPTAARYKSYLDSFKEIRRHITSFQEEFTKGNGMSQLSESPTLELKYDAMLALVLDNPIGFGAPPKGWKSPTKESVSSDKSLQSGSALHSFEKARGMFVLLPPDDQQAIAPDHITIRSIYLLHAAIQILDQSTFAFIPKQKRPSNVLTCDDWAGFLNIPWSFNALDQKTIKCTAKPKISEHLCAPFAKTSNSWYLNEYAKVCRDNHSSRSSIPPVHPLDPPTSQWKSPHEEDLIDLSSPPIQKSILPSPEQHNVNAPDNNVKKSPAYNQDDRSGINAGANDASLIDTFYPSPKEQTTPKPKSLLLTKELHPTGNDGDQGNGNPGRTYLTYGYGPPSNVFIDKETEARRRAEIVAEKAAYARQDKTSEQESSSSHNSNEKITELDISTEPKKNRQPTPRPSISKQRTRQDSLHSNVDSTQEYREPTHHYDSIRPHDQVHHHQPHKSHRELSQCYSDLIAEPMRRILKEKPQKDKPFISLPPKLCETTEAAEGGHGNECHTAIHTACTRIPHGEIKNAKSTSKEALIGLTERLSKYQLVTEFHGLWMDRIATKRGEENAENAEEFMVDWWRSQWLLAVTQTVTAIHVLGQAPLSFQRKHAHLFGEIIEGMVVSAKVAESEEWKQGGEALKLSPLTSHWARTKQNGVRRTLFAQWAQRAWRRVAVRASLRKAQIETLLEGAAAWVQSKELKDKRAAQHYIKNAAILAFALKHQAQSKHLKDGESKS